MMQLNLGRTKKPTAVLILMAVIGSLVALIALYGDPLWELFSSQERIESVVSDAGFFGPFVFMLLQMLQILVAPVPGQVTAFAAGFLFGPFFGTLYAMLGATLGFALVFILARRLGRPFVEYFVDKKTLRKFDYLVESRGILAFFLIFLFPFFPDDLICYVAGLTKLPIKSLLVVSVLGRLPSNLVLVLAGHGAAETDFTLVIFLAATTLVIVAVAWWKRAQLERLIKGMSNKSSPKT